MDEPRQLTDEQRQALCSIGLRTDQISPLLGGTLVAFPLQTQQEPGIGVMALTSTRLRSGVVEIRDPGGGLRTLLRFRSQSMRIARLLGCVELELFGAAVVNARLERLLQGMGFEERIDLCPDELGDEQMAILARVFAVS